MTTTTQSPPVLNWKTNRQLLQIIQNRKAKNTNGTLEVKRHQDMQNTYGVRYELWEIKFYNPGYKYPTDRITFARNTITKEITPFSAHLQRVHHNTYSTHDKSFYFLPEKVEMINPIAEAWVNYYFGQFYQTPNQQQQQHGNKFRNIYSRANGN